MALTQYHSQIEPIAQAYNEAISERGIKEALVKKHGTFILEPQNRAELADKANEYKMEQHRIASDKVKNIQDKAKLEVNDILKRYESAKVNMLSGSELIDKFATRQGLSRSDAETRLRDYARVKTYNFDSNSIADQYAALVNGKDGYTGTNDKVLLDQLHRDYSTRISQLKAEADNILSIVNKNPGSLMHEVSGSGYAYQKMLDNQQQ